MSHFPGLIEPRDHRVKPLIQKLPPRRTGPKPFSDCGEGEDLGHHMALIWFIPSPRRVGLSFRYGWVNGWGRIHGPSAFGKARVKNSPARTTPHQRRETIHDSCQRERFSGWKDEGGAARRPSCSQSAEGMEPDDLLCSRNARPSASFVYREA